MDMNWLEFMLFSLAVFRITRLIVYDTITERIRRPFMDEVEQKDAEGNADIYIVPKESGIGGWIGSLISCYWCTGIWVGAAFFLIRETSSYLYQPLLIIFAAAGMAAVIETVLQKFLYEE